MKDGAHLQLFLHVVVEGGFVGEIAIQVLHWHSPLQGLHLPRLGLHVVCGNLIYN